MKTFKTIKNMTIKIFPLLLLALFVSCDGLFSSNVIEGDGNVTTFVYETEEFNSIELTGIFNVLLTQGEKEEVFLDVDSNLLDKITFDVKNETLYVTTKRDNIVRPTRMNLHITFVDLDKIKASGASKIAASGTIETTFLSVYLSGATDINIEMNVDELSTNLSGAGNVNYSGSAKSHFVSISGAGSLQASDLITDFSKISLSGAGVAYIHASEQLNASLSGVGNIYYAGNPHDTNITRRGIGLIRKQ